MITSLTRPMPTLSDLPVTLPREGAIEIELEQGVLIFRVSKVVQSRIEALLDKNLASRLTPVEEQELKQYEDLDDYLSYLNRLTRNQVEARNETGIKAPTKTRIASLTDREREAATFYSMGMTPSQIAAYTSISLPTVIRLLKSFQRKLVEAVRLEDEASR